jgi:hypothetical protein
MDRGGLKTLIFLLLFESAFRLRIISGSFKYLLLPPMLPHSCPPARVTTQSLEGEGVKAFVLIQILDLRAIDPGGQLQGYARKEAANKIASTEKK